MAESVTLYNHTRYRFGKGLNADTDAYKMLFCTALTIDPTKTTLAGITYTEVANGNGYTTGGFTLQNVSITQVNTDEGTFDADDVAWATTSASGSASYGLLVNTTDSGSPPVLALDFGTAKTVPAGEVLKVIWHPDGIVKFGKPAA